MIESYSFGKIIVNGKCYKSDIVIYNSINENWWRKESHELRIEDIKEILEKKPEVLVVGTGYSGLVKILPETKKCLQERGIKLIAKPTKEACEIYNKLKAKKKRVIAALHLTC